MEHQSPNKRSRVDSSELDSPNTKRIRDDLLTLLDDLDSIPDRDPASQDLDSVIRSFEEEIAGPATLPEPMNFIDLTSDTGESPPEKIELTRIGSESSEIYELWNDLPSYDSFEFGAGGYYHQENTGINDDYVALDGIFDYSDLNFGSDLLWQPETLPAI